MLAQLISTVADIHRSASLEKQDLAARSPSHFEQREVFNRMRVILGKMVVTFEDLVDSATYQ